MQENSIFAEDFDDPGGLKKAADEVEQIFTEQDIKNAESFGHAKGYSEGLNEGYIQGEMQAIKEKDMQLQTALQNINAKLTLVINDNSQFIQNVNNQSCELALTILKTTFPDLINKFLKEEMMMLIKNIVTRIIDKQKINIEVNPDIHQILQPKLKEYFGFDAETIHLTENKDLFVTDINIEWKGGYAYSKIKDNFDALQQLIRENFNIDEVFQLQLTPGGYNAGR